METKINRVLTHMGSVALVVAVLALAVPRDARATIINVPADYSTIQAAIDAASSGDTSSGT